MNIGEHNVSNPHFNPPVSVIEPDPCREFRTEALLSDYSQVLQLRARLQPDRVAYIGVSSGDEEKARYTYFEFDREVRRTAVALQRAGAVGGRVLLVLASDLEFTRAFWACLYAGATAVTTIVPSSREQLRRLGLVAADSGARCVLCTSAVRARIEPGLDLAEGTTWVDVESVGDMDPDEWTPVARQWDDLALLQYTSGSTTEPRGVMVNHRNLLRLGEHQERIFQLRVDDRMVCWLPQSHDFGLMLGVLQPCFSGFEAVVMTPTQFLKQPLRWLEITQRYRGTIWLAPNFAYDLCVDAVRERGVSGLDLSSLRQVVNGAEPIRRPTYERFIETFEPCGFRARSFTNAYGLAETTLAVSATPRSEYYRCLSLSRQVLEENRAVDASMDESATDVMSCGLFGNEVEVRIVETESRRALGARAIGEIWIRGSLVTQGYWGRPGETESLFGARLADGSGPYLRTGDLGFLCERGELFITGRCKDLIIVNGRNHAPQDIELAVELAHPAVRPHCGVAFSVDWEGREVPVVTVELRRESLPGLDLGAVRSAIVRRVAMEHQITLGEVVFLARGGCVKTTSGKVQRRRMRALYLAGELEVVVSTENGAGKGRRPAAVAV